MSDRGKHSRSTPGATFYKDVFLLVAGMLVVGVFVFGALSIWAGRNDDASAASPDTSGSVADATTTTTTFPEDTVAMTDTEAPPASETTGAPVTSTTEDTPEVRAPADVRVIVLNSVGVDGLAGRLTARFDEAGYQTIEPDNYSPRLTGSMIFHADGFGLEATEMLGMVSDGTIASNPDLTGKQGVDIVVVIGDSFEE